MVNGRGRQGGFAGPLEGSGVVQCSLNFELCIVYMIEIADNFGLSESKAEK
jgi:hypothetical protein